MELYSLENSYYQFKREPAIFKYFLQKEGKYTITESGNSIIVGNPAGTNTLTVFLSPYCDHCNKMFNKLKNLLNRSYDIRMMIVMLVDDTEQSKKISGIFYSDYDTLGGQRLMELLEEWYNLPKNDRYDNLTKRYMANNIDNDRLNTLISENNALSVSCKVTGTPALFLNGYKFPQIYDPEDIELFIDDIVQIRQSVKKQGVDV